jgi:N-acetylglucosamine-6-phosphate deacetylase
VPRRNSAVKSKARKTKEVLLARSLGAVDLHFHGAFGIDLMKAQNPELNELAEQLWQEGVAAFCPTTLSTSPDALAEAVERLGRWIRRSRNKPIDSRASGVSPIQKSAVPLGVHLEGPFINSNCCGAHPPELIRPFDLKELERLWNVSQETLKILTLAPEHLNEDSLTQLVRWCHDRQVVLSIGHSKATESQARHAFQAGFRGITHAWNALPFHQRAPGALAAAFSHLQSYVEIIIDQVHVAPSVIRWTETLQPADRLCYVSDCAPAAETDGKIEVSFGPLKIRFADGACRLEGGALAGGGKLLSRAFSEWVRCQTPLGNSPSMDKSAVQKELKRRLPSITTAPLCALGIAPRSLKDYQVEWWYLPGGKIRAKSLQ